MCHSQRGGPVDSDHGVSFRMSFFEGLFARSKRSGVAVFNELVDQLIRIGNGWKSARGLTQDVARAGYELTPDGQREMLAVLLVVFCEDSLNFAVTARKALAQMKNYQIDFTDVAEVEYLTLLTAINAILTGESIAREVAAARDQMALAMRVYNEVDYPLRQQLDEVAFYADIADAVKFHRSLNSPDYVSNYLEMIRVKIPADIAVPASRLFADQGVAGRRRV